MSLSFERDIADESATRARARHPPRPHTLCERSELRARASGRPASKRDTPRHSPARARQSNGSQKLASSINHLMHTRGHITACNRARLAGGHGQPLARAPGDRQPLRARIATAGRAREQPTAGRPRAIPCEL